MFQLSEDTKTILERNIGVTLSELASIDDADQIRIVESVIQQSLFFVEEHGPGRIGRGAPLLVGKSFKTIDEVNSRIDAIIKEK